MIFVLLNVLTCLVCAVPINYVSKAEEYTNDATAHNSTLLPMSCAIVVERQLSKKKCTLNKRYGLKDNCYTIWVDNGCRADFTVNQGNGDKSEITCSSNDFKYDECELRDWRVYTETTARRDEGHQGGENCWDVAELVFFDDSLCSNSITTASNARISSGFAKQWRTSTYITDNAFDGNINTIWGGRSIDGDFGSEEVWIGALGIANVRCIKLTQGLSHLNHCRPASLIKIQKRIPGTTDWITEMTVPWGGDEMDGELLIGLDDEDDWLRETVVPVGDGDFVIGGR